jgi:microcystin-dependent protein
MDYYLGEIRLFAFGQYAPADFLPCDGRAIDVNANQALFALIGTTYGGDGIHNFNLPNLIGRAIVHVGKNPTGTPTYTLGQTAGVASVIVGTANLPNHTHSVSVSNQAATTMIPSPTVVHAAVGTGNVFYETSGTASAVSQTFALDTISNANNSQTPTSAHSNLQPTVALQYAICVNGIFPTGN